MAGKYGKRPAKNARSLRFAEFWTGAIPEHPTAQHNMASLSGWQMLGNDRAGDCVAVTWANIRRIITTVLGGRETYATQELVWDVYRTQNPHFDPNGSANTNGPGSDADQGMDIQTLLEWLHANGSPDGGHLVAFAKVDHTNIEEVKAALSIFGVLWVGFNVQEINESQFNQGEPWDYSKSSPYVGGHSVTAGGYFGKASADIEFETWADVTSFTDACWSHNVDEVWVPIWQEHIGTTYFRQGVDATALADAYKALTGQELPVSPKPTPTPVPVDSDDLMELFHKAAVVMDKWAHLSHSAIHENKQAAEAWKEYAKNVRAL